MKIKILAWIFFLSVLFVQTGCGKEDAVYLESAVLETEEKLWEDTVDESVPGMQEEPTGPAECYVYVCGAVAQPGVYILPEGSRIYQAIQLAGGFLPDAEPSAVNQAEAVYDGQMLWIPTVEEAAADSDMTGDGGEAADDGLININTATAEELMTLSGIGESKAKSIVEYRTGHGNFQSIEELMNVDGIKEGVFNRVKDSIKVK